MATTGMASNSFRRGASQPNRHNRSNFNGQRPSGRRNTQQINPDDLIRNENLVAALMHMMGQTVRLVVSNGHIYEGILSSISKECNVELREVLLVPKDGEKVSRDPLQAMLFLRSNYIELVAQNIDLRAESFTDSAISRANGQSNDGREVPMKELVAWEGGSENTAVSLEASDGSNGWDANEMFQTNEKRFQVKSTYSDNLPEYTVPVPQFASKAEQMEAERRASEQAREIENSEGYRQRISVENNPEIDEESKFSSVVRPSGDTASSAGKTYVAPGRRQQEHQGSHNQRGAGPMPPMPAHQPLPQRERRADRDRGDRGWERNPPLRSQHSAPGQQQGPSAPSHPKENHTERANGDRRGEPPGRSYSGRPGQMGPGHHHSGAPGAGAVSQASSVGPQNQHQPAQSPYSLPMAGSGQSSIQQGGPHAPPPTTSVPSSAPQMPVVRSNPPPAAAAAAAPVVSSAPNTATPPQANRAEAAPMAAQAQHQQPPPPGAAFQGSDKKSPRDNKDHRRDQKMLGLKQFKENFNLADESAEPRGSLPERAPVDRKSDSHPQAADDSQGNTAGAGATASPQGATANPVSTQGSPAQSQGAQTVSQGTTVSEPSQISTLNPLATEFKPRQQTQQAAVIQGASPGPTTSPSQGPRQSPGMVSHQQILPYAHHGNQYLVTNVQHPKMMSVAAAANHPHGPNKQYQPPKRAVVSVDPVALAHSATGQPLTIAQGATIQPPNYIYNVISQPGPYQSVMRVLPSIPPQGAAIDPNQGPSGQQTHMPQQFIMAHQQPVPAHMPAAQPLTQSMPQPAHTMHQHHQHIPHQTHPSNLPPVSQSQNVTPHPSVSPVQHMGANGHSHGPNAPQMNHNQGAPPTSGTPQPQMAYGHHIPGLPPQGAAPHALPAHSVSQGPNALQYIHQHQLPGGVSFSQAGPTASGGPTPAHVQSSGPVNVVVMPHPPPQAINQAPINNQHQQQQQHVPAQYQQQLHGAANPLHGPVGHNQHLLQGHVPGAGTGMAMQQHIPHFLQQGMQQGSHNPHSHSVSHSHSHGHGHSHAHNHPHPHYQGQ